MGAAGGARVGAAGHVGGVGVAGLDAALSEEVTFVQCLSMCGILSCMCIYYTCMIYI